MLPWMLLNLLKDAPHHGSEMIAFLGEMTDGAWKPSPGSVYPILRRFEREGLFRGSWQRGRAAPRRVYRLTDEGRAKLPGLRRDLVAELEAAREIIDQHLQFLRHTPKASPFPAVNHRLPDDP